jgi:putative transposase
LVTHYVLFVTPYPGAAWMLQIGRNLTDAFTGFFLGKSFLIIDRDSSFHEAFRDLLERAGLRAVRTPPRLPNCNAHLVRYHGSFKREVANRMIFFGERQLQHSIEEFLEYYHGERNHQGLDGRIIDPPNGIGSSKGDVRNRERLGGMLNYYYRDAA